MFQHLLFDDTSQLLPGIVPLAVSVRWKLHSVTAEVYSAMLSTHYFFAPSGFGRIQIASRSWPFAFRVLAVVPVDVSNSERGLRLLVKGTKIQIKKINRIMNQDRDPNMVLN